MTACAGGVHSAVDYIADDDDGPREHRVRGRAAGLPVRATDRDRPHRRQRPSVRQTEVDPADVDTFDDPEPDRDRPPRVAVPPELVAKLAARSENRPRVKASAARDAIVLAQAVFWCELQPGSGRANSTIYIDDRYWWGGTYSGFSAELGLTVKQVRDAFDRLTADGYLTRQADAGNNLVAPSQEIIDLRRTSRSVVIPAALVAVCREKLPTPDPAAALLLADLWYWQIFTPEENRQAGGAIWKSYGRLQTETGLSRDQIKRDLKRLRAAGLIEFESRLPRGKRGRPQPIILVDVPRLKRLTDSVRQRSIRGAA